MREIFEIVGMVILSIIGAIGVLFMCIAIPVTSVILAIKFCDYMIKILF